MTRPCLHRRHVWLALGALPLLATAREPALGLMQGIEAPAGIVPRGFLVSEKLDGVRARWTGHELRFRGGGLVRAPKTFTAPLPQGVVLDGELWGGRGRFEQLSGTVRRARPDEAAWQPVQFALFDLPGDPRPFAERAQALQRLAARIGSPWLSAVPQSSVEGAAALRQRLVDVVAGGGEGLMLHRASALWREGRSDDLLKLKPLHDAEATVVGSVPGQGRHAGRMGALRVRLPNGTEFRLGTGFSDAEREQPPAVGSVVTFSHQGHTEDGVPRFARFVRVWSGP